MAGNSLPTQLKMLLKISMLKLRGVVVVKRWMMFQTGESVASVSKDMPGHALLLPQNKTKYIYILKKVKCIYIYVCMYICA